MELSLFYVYIGIFFLFPQKKKKKKVQMSNFIGVELNAYVC